MVIARVDEPAGLFSVVGHAPILIPEGSRPAMAETVARANCCLKVGKFELDVEGGGLRLQTSQILTDDGLNGEVIGRLIDWTVTMLDRYVPAVLSVIYGNELPKDAIRQVEAAR